MSPGHAGRWGDLAGALRSRSRPDVVSCSPSSRCPAAIPLRYRWVQQANNDVGRREGVQTEVQAEPAGLTAENERLREAPKRSCAGIDRFAGEIRRPVWPMCALFDTLASQCIAVEVGLYCPHRQGLSNRGGATSDRWLCWATTGLRLRRPERVRAGRLVQDLPRREQVRRQVADRVRGARSHPNRPWHMRQLHPDAFRQSQRSQTPTALRT